MPKYIVQHTPILHGPKGADAATLHEVGSAIELTAEEAERLGDNVLAEPAKKTRAAAESAE